jgi:hypothetical protein
MGKVAKLREAHCAFVIELVAHFPIQLATLKTSTPWLASSLQFHFTVCPANGDWHGKSPAVPNWHVSPYLHRAEAETCMAYRWKDPELGKWNGWR